mgnify:CR=1 FL=1
MPIYKNVAFPNVAFQSLSTSGAANTSTTPTVTISKDGGAPAAASNAPTHVGGGHWKIDLSQAEMNANVVVLTATASGCVPSQREFYTEADYTSARAALLARGRIRNQTCFHLGRCTLPTRNWWGMRNPPRSDEEHSLSKL